MARYAELGETIMGDVHLVAMARYAELCESVMGCVHMVEGGRGRLDVTCDLVSRLRLGMPASCKDHRQVFHGLRCDCVHGSGLLNTAQLSLALGFAH